MSHIAKDVILTSTSNSTIRAYHPHTIAPLSSFSGSLTPRQGLTFTKKGLIAATHISPNASSDGHINLYNWRSPTPFHSIQAPEPVAPVVSTPDGSFIFSGGASGRIHAFSLPSLLLHRTFQAHRGPVSCMSINDDGTLLVSGAEDGTIAAFPVFQALDVHTDCLSPLYRFNASDSEVTCIGIGGAYMISSSVDGTCKVWNAANGSHVRTFRFGCSMLCVCMDFGSSMAYGGGSDGRVYGISMRRKSRRKEVEIAAWGGEESGTVVAVGAINNGKSLVSGFEDGMVKVWDVESGKIVSVLGSKESGSIRGLLVARIFEDGSVGGCGMSGGDGFCGRVIRSVGENVEEMKGWLDAARKDRSRAMDMLEEAMQTYERLLGLLLREANGGEDENKKEATHT